MLLFSRMLHTKPTQSRRLLISRTAVVFSNAAHKADTKPKAFDARTIVSSHAAHKAEGFLVVPKGLTAFTSTQKRSRQASWSYLSKGLIAFGT